MDSDIPLELENLVIKYGNRVAVDGVSFRVSSGEVYCLLGPNGAGKSSTLRAVVGILGDYEGKITVFGKSPREDKHVKNLIGYVPEEPLLPESLTPRDIIEFSASIRKIDEKNLNDRLARLLDSLLCEEFMDIPVFALSRGNKQKLLIILALLHEPRLLVLDEPFIGLDALSSKVLKEYLKRHAEKKNAVLLSTHILDIAEKICGRIGIIDRGALIAEGKMSELAEISRSRKGLEDLFLKLTKREEWVYEVIKALEG